MLPNSIKTNNKELNQSPNKCFTGQLFYKGMKSIIQGGKSAVNEWQLDCLVRDFGRLK